MNDNDNRRPRRRAARSAGPPAEEKAAVTVAVSKSESVSPAAEAAQSADTVKFAKGAAAPTVKFGKDAVEPAAPTEKIDKDAVDSSAPTVKFTGGIAQSEDSAVPNVPDAEKKSRVRRVLAVAAAAVLVLALMVGAGVSAVAAFMTDAEEDLRAEYTETARQAVLNLTTIRAESAKEDIDRILAVASGDFKSEFDGRVDPFMDVVKQANVVSNGSVVESAIVSADLESAQVLVAAKQTVTNNGSPEPQSRQYRFRITVTNGETGMTVSKVEFVG
ncbi:hypothetical protein [Nocardia coubleae]|uniref:Mce-associated membrane protein n=1 Tax=Nocardia coubleae TaxID=356147 RepID=A0A846W713_9NOCA|nr:hypothetical protein [Nocardia coubleae]NKX89001.1 hypothetical protein [Nocardia coubleae]